MGECRLFTGLKRVPANVVRVLLVVGGKEEEEKRKKDGGNRERLRQNEGQAKTMTEGK